MSIASLWEITIKNGTGKLAIGTPLGEFFSFLERNKFDVLDIELSHLFQLSQLPVYHKDPFDRWIIAQALADRLPVATRDDMFKLYEAEIIW